MSQMYTHPHLHITHINVFQTEQCTYLHTLLPAQRDNYLHGNIDKYFTDLYIQHNTQGLQHLSLTQTPIQIEQGFLCIHFHSELLCCVCVPSQGCSLRVNKDLEMKKYFPQRLYFQ